MYVLFIHEGHTEKDALNPLTRSILACNTLSVRIDEV